MKKKVMAIILIAIVAVFIAVFFTSCTENQRAKKWGGTMSITVPAGEEFVNATWKDNNLWIIT